MSPLKETNSERPAEEMNSDISKIEHSVLKEFPTNRKSTVESRQKRIYDLTCWYRGRACWKANVKAGHSLHRQTAYFGMREIKADKKSMEMIQTACHDWNSVWTEIGTKNQRHPERD
ncbi:hypothetical protein AVEN_784-1 [Araneus ventricosus]|uniref:Uncharacterized protein n=1 Tax=Araneus ventricosus TaxID=182803 RepID=A0A4Y2H460_ARAVE|nr:hypothetical protein AVEN_784-1 [Araneus ventricosus]